MIKFTVLGAGMAGLFAASVLRDECQQVLEMQRSIPNNHNALLRFRTSIVGDALNIRFDEVDVMKWVESTGNPINDAISYSLKTNGTARLRSITTARGEIEKRFIAPSDFISRMALKVQAPIHLNSEWGGGAVGEHIISTLPMPVLMDILQYPYDFEFSSVRGYTITADLYNTDVCATIYFPLRDEYAYRASITRDNLIIEFCNNSFPSFQRNMEEDELSRLEIAKYYAARFGITGQMIDKCSVKFNKQHYAKILPIPEEERRKFILWASKTHNIYSFGRFATWRPGLMMDDLVNDLRVIQRLARGSSSYDAVKR